MVGSCRLNSVVLGLPNVADEYGIRCVGDTVDNSAYVRSCVIKLKKGNRLDVR